MKRVNILSSIALLLLSIPAWAQWTDPGNDGTGNVYYNNGNIGIGTSDPSSLLQVEGQQATLTIKGSTVGSQAWKSRILLDRIEDYRGAGMWITASTGQEADWYAGVPYTGLGFTIGHHATDPERKENYRLSIDTAGNVKIKGGLVVEGRNMYVGENRLYGNGSYLYHFSDDNDRTGMTFFDKDSQRYGYVYGNENGNNFGLLDGDGGWSYMAVKDNHTSFHIDNGEKMRIRVDGKVGIGTTNPQVMLHVAGAAEATGAQVIGFGNLDSDDMNTNNKYRVFSGATFTDGVSSMMNRYFTYNSVHGAYLDYNGQGHGFYSQGAYPRMFIETTSGNHGYYANLPADSPIENFFLYQQIKGPAAEGLVGTTVKATKSNSTWLWGVRDNGDLIVAEKIGIGTTAPTSRLTVTGTIESTTGGIKFPDGTIQTTAASGSGAWTTAGAAISYDGNVGIGTTAPQYDLDIVGTVRTCEVKVSNLEGWCDYVFEEDYNLPELEEVEAYIKSNKHLMDIPSEAEVMEHGISLGSMDAALLKKVEELTLYMIEQNKLVKNLVEENKEQKEQIERLQSRLN